MSLAQRNYWVSSAYLFTLFSGYAFIYSMYAIWMSQTAELSGSQIGIVFAMNSIGAICLQPALGFIQDKLGTRQHLLWLNLIFLLGSGLFFTYVYSGLLNTSFYLGAAVGAFYIAFVFLAMAGTVETYLERLSRLSSFEYGKVRLWGSLGWGSAALFGGILINQGGEFIFWVASATALIPIFILAFVRIKTKEYEEPSEISSVQLSDVFAVFKIKKFYFFALFVLGVATLYTVYDQQFPVFYASLFDEIEFGNEMYGYLNSAQIFLEALGFFVAPLIVLRIGAKKGLLVAGAIMVFRIFCSAVIDNEIALSFVKLLHAAELPILMVAIFKYLNLHFDPRLSSTLYLVSFMFVMQFGAGAMSPIFGILYDTIGFQSSYLIMAMISFAFLLFSTFLLEPDSAGHKELDEAT